MLSNTVIMAIYAAWTAWTGYILWKLLKIPRVGHAVRYGIPVGIVGWGVAEMPAHFGLYSEIWLKPFDYAVTNSIMLAIFTAGMIYMEREPRNSIQAGNRRPGLKACGRPTASSGCCESANSRSPNSANLTSARIHKALRRVTVVVTIGRRAATGVAGGASCGISGGIQCEQ